MRVISCFQIDLEDQINSRFFEEQETVIITKILLQIHNPSLSMKRP